MRRIAPFILCFCFITANTASAQNWPSATPQLTEQQKCRLHLPYIRAATDCVAREIAASPTALDHAAWGDWPRAYKASSWTETPWC